jgi:hypothetical protein
MQITDTSTLNRVEIDMLSRTIHLHGDDGEYLKVEEKDSEDFTKMCNFVNQTLSSDMIEYKY